VGGGSSASSMLCMSRGESFRVTVEVEPKSCNSKRLVFIVDNFYTRNFERACVHAEKNVTNRVSLEAMRRTDSKVKAHIMR
jgi:hypothetical protein